MGAITAFMVEKVIVEGRRAVEIGLADEEI